MALRRKVGGEKRWDGYIVTMAELADEPELRKVLSEHDLAVCGDAEDYAVLKVNGVVCAAARLVPVGRNSYHLEVFGVRGELRGKGAGGYLLSEIINNPWRYSRSSEKGSEQFYRITTVARGDAVMFYQKYGFKPYTFAALPPPYNTQCEGCQDRQTCRPVPMVYEKKGR